MRRPVQTVVDAVGQVGEEHEGMSEGRRPPLFGAVAAGLVSALGCQLGPGGSWFDGAVCAAGRSLPEMSLAFALMAAINGSTGSWATLSHGL